MATIDDKDLINEIIKKDGYYLDDPRIYMIVEYTNAYGNITWGVTWCNEQYRARTRYLIETDYVKNPKIIWHSENY